MRIAFVVNNYPPRMGGLESHVSSLARHLIEQGHEVFVYTLAEQPGAVVEGGIRVTRFRELFQVGSVLGVPVLGTSRRIRRALRSEEIDIVSVHTRFFPLSWIGSKAARRACIPVIHTEHGSGHVKSESGVITIASRIVDCTLGKSEILAADAVLGVSEEVLDFVYELTGRQGAVFFNAIEASATQKELAVQPALGREASLRPQRLVFIGRLVPGKGWEDFIDLLEMLSVEGYPVSAEILGDGPDMEAVQGRVAKSSVSDRIRVRGRVGAAEVRAALQGATLVNPTRLSEGFQTTLLESLAEGGQVLTYPVPGAQVLSEEGCPVWITSDRTVQDLYNIYMELLTTPKFGTPEGFLDAWTWPGRTRQFLEVCNRVLTR